MRQVSPNQLNEWLADASRPKPVLLDVREPWEADICRIAGSVLIPMQQIVERHQELKSDAPTVVICHHGARSFQVGMWLAQSGFEEVINLQGGVNAWANEVEPAMARY